MTEPRSPDDWLRLAEEQAARARPRDDAPAWPDPEPTADAEAAQPTGPAESEAAGATAPPSPPAPPVAPSNRVAAPPSQPARPPSPRPRPPAADRGAWSRPRRVVEASAPYLTQGVLAVMAAVFLYDMTLSGNAERQFLVDWALLGPAIEAGRWWQLLTPAFLHADLLHIGFNGYLLWVLGGQYELARGHLRFGLVFFGSVLGGSLGALILEPNQVAVGASGGVFGIFGAYAVMMLVRGLNPLQSQIGGLIVLNLAFTFLVPGISIGGHLGGLVAGGILGGILTWADDHGLDTAGKLAAGATTLVLFVLGLLAA